MWKKFGNIYNASHAQVPVALSNEESWRIYFSDRVEGKSVPRFVDISKSNYKAIFQGKIEVQHGRRGMFDWAGIMPTSVVRIDKDTIFLYYIGWSVRKDVPYHNNLGLMISHDGGSTFEKISDGPIFSTSRKEPGYVGTMYVLQDESLFKGWYLSCRNWIENSQGGFEPIYDIKYATSKDGIDWEPTGKTSIPLEENEGGISQASVLKDSKGKYHMWFSVRGKTDFRSRNVDSYRIKYATSLEGTSWVRKDISNLGLSESGWDSKMVEYPCVLQENKRLFMFYNGDGFGKTGIGLATWDPTIKLME